MAGGDFEARMRARARVIQQKLQIAQAKIGVEISTRVIAKTPVDTGRARGSWMPSIGSPAGHDPGTVDKRELGDRTGPVVERAAAVALTVNGDTVFYLTSSLPYINRLEHGSSSQATSGMVGVTVQEFKSVVERVAKELNK